MHYGDEHFIEVNETFDLEGVSRARLNSLFRNAPRISAFESTPPVTGAASALVKNAPATRNAVPAPTRLKDIGYLLSHVRI